MVPVLRIVPYFCCGPNKVNSLLTLVPVLWPITLDKGPFVPTHFRALEQPGNANRKDEILRASISAFVALSKPNKRDCNQIEDLTLPILPYASGQTKRFVCAALAESASAPQNLIRRLCDETADICAPLLLLSPVLTAIDLVSVIGRKGKEHARVIARRSHLPNDVIEALALVDDARTRARAAGDAGESQTLTNVKPATAEQARALLAEMVLSIDERRTEVRAGAGVDTDPSGHLAAEKLVRLALHEETGLLATALADISGLSFGRTQRILKRTASGEILTLLRALSVGVDKAFVIACALNPHTASSRLEIRLMRERFEQIDPEKAVDTVRRWKADEISVEFRRRAANADARGLEGEIKAS